MITVVPGADRGPGLGCLRVVASVEDARGSAEIQRNQQVKPQLPLPAAAATAAAAQPNVAPLHFPCSQGIRKQLAAHPVVVALIFFIMIFSGGRPGCERLQGTIGAARTNLKAQSSLCPVVCCLPARRAVSAFRPAAAQPFMRFFMQCGSLQPPPL